MVRCGVVSLVTCVMVGMWSCAEATVCEVWERVPANHHMCYSVQAVEEVEVLQNIPRKKWVLQEPVNCKSPFPCFGVVREVVELEPVAVTVQVCQLQPIWSTPRPIRESYRGVALVLSPECFHGSRNTSSQCLCLWNISCHAEEQALFVNFTGSSSQLPVSEGSDECGGEYAVAEWGEQREMRCAGQASEWLQNRIFPGNLKVILRSQAGGSFARNFRLNTACYDPAPPDDTLQDTNCTEYAPHSSGHQLYQLMEACRDSVRECGYHYSHHLNLGLRHELELALSPPTCNPLLQAMFTATRSMYGH